MKQTVKVYDNGGKSIDRYTAVFQKPCDGEYQYLGMSGSPFHPQGVGYHGHARFRIGARECGRRIKITDLPIDCQLFVNADLAAYQEVPL